MSKQRLSDDTIDELVAAVARTLRRELRKLAGPTRGTSDREFISRRTRDAIADRKAAGIYSGGRALPQARPVDDDIAERIAALAADGLSTRQIAKQLTDEEVPTARGAAAWSHTTVQSVLRREAKRC